jgi:hypothetical protein
MTRTVAQAGVDLEEAFVGALASYHMLGLISIAAERGFRCGDLPDAVATHQFATYQE